MLALVAARTLNRAAGTSWLGTETAGGDPDSRSGALSSAHPPPQATTCGGGWDVRWSYGVTLAT
jgi:hypothetical protein